MEWKLNIQLYARWHRNTPLACFRELSSAQTNVYKRECVSSRIWQRIRTARRSNTISYRQRISQDSRSKRNKIEEPFTTLEISSEGKSHLMLFCRLHLLANAIFAYYGMQTTSWYISPSQSFFPFIDDTYTLSHHQSAIRAGWLCQNTKEIT